MAHLRREPLHPAPAPPSGCTQLGTRAEATPCDVPGSPVCCPWFLVGKSGEKSPVVPQACGIRQSGTRFGSSLGRRGVISIPAMARPALSSGQVWEQPQGPRARGGAAGTLLPPYAFAEPLPHCWPRWAAPRPRADPQEGAAMLSAGSDVQHCSVLWEPAPFARLGSGEQRQVCPQRAAACAQEKGTWWCPCWQHAGMPALPVCHCWPFFWGCTVITCLQQLRCPQGLPRLSL